MEWVANYEMRRLLDSIADKQGLGKLEMDMYHLNKLFCPPFQKIRDCILISNKSRDILEEFFDVALETYMDKTGYEASSSETQINNFFDNKLSITTGTQIAYHIL